MGPSLLNILTEDHTKQLHHTYVVHTVSSVQQCSPVFAAPQFVKFVRLYIDAYGQTLGNLPTATNALHGMTCDVHSSLPC